MSKFKDVRGNLELTVLGVFYALIGAGFYEEFTFRGFLMQGLAMLFGASRAAWIVACVVQGALFGAAPRLPESSRYRDHRHAGRFDGTAGSCVRPQSLAGDHWPRTLRRESFRFVLFAGAADGLSCSTQPYLDPAGVTAPGYRCSAILSAIQQAPIEAILDWLADFDFFKIRVLGIQKEVHLACA